MNYVPDLIPKDKKVLPHYFKPSTPTSNKDEKSPKKILSIIGSCLAFLVALGNIDHPLLFLLLLVIGLTLLPKGHQWLEQQFQFRFTAKIKSVFIGGLLLTSLPLFSYYGEMDRKEAQRRRQRAKEREAEKKLADQKEQARKDSVRLYLGVVDSLTQASKPEAALATLAALSQFSPTPEETIAIDKAKNAVFFQRTLASVKSGDYKKALPELSILLQADPNNPELLYNRALCYSKTGQLPAAVADLKRAIELGSEKAEALHEKINPLRKRIAYYVTRCWDGTTSSATGRGACSHHGGVKNWNDPVYEEYRKY